jgi:DNA-binding NtrC family response regulator
VRIAPDTKRVLLIEGDASMRTRVEAGLAGAGYHVSAAAAPADGAALLAREQFDAVIASIADSGDAGIDDLRRQAGATPILVLCDPAQVEIAVGWMQRGVEDYLLRPPDRVELGNRLGRILERHELDSRIAFFQDEISKKHGLKRMEAHSPAMRGVLKRVVRVAPMRSTVLIQGESGSGKELVARAIHFDSPRSDGPFIALNCAAISPSLIESELFGHEKGAFTGAHSRTRGKFEVANGGTLFLDEIAEMAPATQVKLLRVLEEREFMRVGGDRSLRVDVRVIAATNADLLEHVRRGNFRQDLFYRLKVVTIRVPPLRERRQDIPHLVRGFLGELARTNAVEPKTVTDEVMAALGEYAWPGNVRELKNLLESLLVSVTARVIRPEDLPAYVLGSRAPAAATEIQAGTTLAEMERALIRRTLEATGGNRTHSASLLGIGVRTLQRKIRGYGLQIASTRRRPRAARAGASVAGDERHKTVADAPRHSSSSRRSG